jgi:hypothetical protein
MDFIKEIWDRSLPNFGYVINMDNGGQWVGVLGGQTIRKGDTSDLVDPISRRNKQMQYIYRQESLSDADKTELTRLLDKMYGICECRKEGLYYRNEQAAFIEKLTKNEKAQLEFQIQMLKTCRSFYPDYGY